MYIGAGTVTKTSQLKLTNYSGGKFIIAPNTDPHIIEQTKLLDLISIPGAMTVSEIFNAMSAGADYVKTCTGFSGGAANVHAIALMRATVGPDMGVKASGGVRDYATAKALIEAGSTRVGASAGIAIVAGEQ